MQRTFTSFLAGAAMFAAVGSAQATVISGGTATNGPTGTLTDYTTTLGTLTKFDTTLGTLNSVTFNVSYSFTSTIGLTATTASNGDVFTRSAAQFSSSDSAVYAVLNALVNVIPTAVVGGQGLSRAAYKIDGDDDIYSLAAGQTSTYTSNGSGSSTYTTTNASYLAAFMATGSSSFDAIGKTLTATVLSQTGGNALASQVTSAIQSIEIDYNYTAAPPPPPTGVPEPTSIALLGAGLLGLGLIRRKA